MSIVNPEEQVHDPQDGARGVKINHITPLPNESDLTTIRIQRAQIERELTASETFENPQQTCQAFLSNEYSFAINNGSSTSMEEAKRLFELLSGKGDIIGYLRGQSVKYLEDGKRNAASTTRSVQQFG